MCLMENSIMWVSQTRQTNVGKPNPAYPAAVVKTLA